MNKRFIVVADYPNSKFEVGKVLTAGSNYTNGVFTKYPHLFRELSWWEHRDESKMGGYFKSWWRGDEYYIKVDKWEKDGTLYHYKADGMTFSCTYSTPITESQYTAYINDKK